MENSINISNTWFDEGRIYMRDMVGTVHSRPLEAFPLLMDATEEQRMAYDIDPQGDAVRWPEIDEDIHVSSFFEQNEPDSDNEIARLFRQFPRPDVSDVAQRMGISKSLLSKYIYGIKTPSGHRCKEIKRALRTY